LIPSKVAGYSEVAALCGSQFVPRSGFCVHDKYKFTAFPVLKQAFVEDDYTLT
jgi:hypothetical protein